MPINRLRRVLASTLEITVDSSQSVSDSVNARARPEMRPKTAVPYAPLLGATVHGVRPIDLLRKIGEVTTPRAVNLARLSASWATRRYFWCIQEARPLTAQSPFRLSPDARRMERHQKTLLSDEFGVGFAALLMEQLFHATNVVDMEFALADPVQYFGVQANASRRRPDYLMWAPGGTVYVVECKGCQTSRAGALNQLRRGMEQVPTISIPGSAVPQLVIGTYMAARATTVFVVDPPSDDRTDFGGMSESDEVQRKGPREFTISDEVAFRTKLRRGSNLQHLRWISQHATAAMLESSVGYRGDRPSELPDAELVSRETPEGNFVGVEAPLAPEYGFTGPLIFRGVERTLYDSLRAGELEAVADIELPAAPDPTISIGADGSCLLVRNLPI